MTRDQFHDELGGFGSQLTAATERAERRRRRARRATGVVAATALIAGAAVVAVPGASPLDPVAEARAALGTGNEILHFKVSMRFGGPERPGDPSPARLTDFSPPQEIWATTSGAVRWRTHMPPTASQCNGLSVTGNVSWVGATDSAYRNGRIRLYSPYSRLIVVLPKQQAGSAGVPIPMLPEEFGADARDPASTIRSALERGLLKDAGVADVGGRRVRTLRGEVGPSGSVPDSSYSYDQRTGKKKLLRPGKRINQRPTQLTYTVDADTFAPIDLTSRRYSVWSWAGNRPHYVWTTTSIRFLTFERLAPTAVSRQSLELDAPAGTRTAWVKAPRTDARGLPKIAPRVAKASMAASRAAQRRCRAATR